MAFIWLRVACLFYDFQEEKKREKEQLEQMLEENRRKIEEAQRRAAEEQARKEEERYRELEALQRQKEEALRRKKLEEDQNRTEQMKILGKKNTRPKLSFALGFKWHDSGIVLHHSRKSLGLFLYMVSFFVE